MTAVVSRSFAFLTIAADVFVIASLVVLLGARWSATLAGVKDRWRESLGGAGLALAWTAAAVATLGSLYYSEVAHFVPCELCWYQRIAMYPWAVVLGIAYFRADRAIARYVWPVIGIGAAISVYHLLVERFPSLAGSACDAAAPCNILWVNEFGFVTIPFMALSAFLLIATALAWAWSASHEDADARSGPRP